MSKDSDNELKDYCGDCGHHYTAHERKEQTLEDGTKFVMQTKYETWETLEFGNIPYKCLEDGCDCEKFVTPEWDSTDKEIKEAVKEQKIKHKHLGLKNNPCPCCVDKVALRQNITTRAFRKREAKKREKREKEEKRQKTRLMNLKRYGHA